MGNLHIPILVQLPAAPFPCSLPHPANLTVALLGILTVVHKMFFLPSLAFPLLLCPWNISQGVETLGQ